MSVRLLLAATVFGLSFTQLVAQTPSHIQDLRDWHALGLPAAAEWNTNGHPSQYHVDLLKAGHRFVPSIRLDASSTSNNDPKLVPAALALTAESWQYLSGNGAPLCLRTQNISSVFASALYRPANDPANMPKSPVTWRLVSGKYDQQPIIDNFGPASIWATEGGLWGKSLLMKNLQVKHPSPAWVSFVENNEGPYESMKRYAKIDGTQFNEYGYPKQTWLPSATLKTLSLRMESRVAQLLQANPQSNPYDFQPEYWSHRRDQYAAFYTAFEAQLGASWKGKTYTAGYKGMSDARDAQPAMFFDALGYAPQLLYFDAGSEPVYCNGSIMTDFTSLVHTDVLNLIPAWETARARNPQAYRELSLLISDGGVYVGAQAGLHEIMTPQRWEGYVQWLLWSIHEPGVPVLLRRFSGSSVKPTTLLFQTNQYAMLDSLGAASLKTATSETYLLPILSAVDRVCINPTLRSYWLQGKGVTVPGLGHPSRQVSKLAPYPRPGDPDNRWRVLECSTNPPRANWKPVNGIYTEKIKLWAVATRLGDSVLLYAWTPCKLSGPVTVTIPDIGTVSINAPQPWGYWTVKSGGTPIPVAAP